jgi:hypothetical protein
MPCLTPARPSAWFASLLALCLFLAPSLPATAQVPAGVLAQLSRGINLSFWFTYRDDPRIDPRFFQPDDADLAALKQMGFRHARIPFDHAWLVDKNDATRADTARSVEFANALSKVSAQGLFVIVTMNVDNDYSARMLTSEATLKEASAFWWSLAKQLSSRLPPDKLLFEIYNEPGNEDAAASLHAMHVLAGSVRDAAPKHTIAVAGHRYSSVDELVVVKPIHDDNLVYSFHFYDPPNFTHQGASWGWPMWMVLRGLPYPSTPEGLAPVVATLTPAARTHAEWYGTQQWNRDKLATFVDRAAAWSQQHGVPIWCSEFGVLRDVAPPASRRAWTTDTRELFESRGIAWTHFDWWGHFGLVTGVPGARSVDEDVRVGLGLAAP